ncbi:Aste57867_10459 [Aphanomyces stellatus]|uniref:Aste57867_10459 protein n=1 Tax=Aphanomyces stellatus TaxID=120398 RepID=A0A485KRE6_9STRA|nr:hypothetical protein As57867_010419 [Aphanomyces stellatus]VFT87333.1 Aste57867_10459 [Aphanomyces stellatus]
MQRKIRKRGYMRTFMQVYRGREKEEVESLKRQVEDLELELARRLHAKQLAPGSGDSGAELPWRDVAAAMEEMHHDGILEQRALEVESDDVRTVAFDLHGWVASFSRPSTSPNPRTQTWRDVTLLSHPRSRQLGKQWITQHMYHNADRVFALQECPPTQTTIINNTWDIDFSGDCYYVVERGHVDWNMPLENVRSMFRNHMCSMFTLDSFCPLTTHTLTETSDNTVLHQLVPPSSHAMYARYPGGPDAAAAAQYVNLLGGEFNQADRSIVVVTQIQDDELIAPCGDLTQRSRMTWLELYRESPHRTRGRYVSIVSQQFTHERYISMAEEVRGWGYDLSQVPEWEQEARFLQLHRARNEALKASRQQWYSSIIAEEMQHCHDDLPCIKVEATDVGR